MLHNTDHVLFGEENFGVNSSLQIRKDGDLGVPFISGILGGQTREASATLHKISFNKWLCLSVTWNDKNTPSFVYLNGKMILSFVTDHSATESKKYLLREFSGNVLFAGVKLSGGTHISQEDVQKQHEYFCKRYIIDV